MPRLRFGAFLAPHHPIGEHPMLQFRRDLDLVEHLDQLGYDEFWCGEHHSSGWEMIASPEMFLAAAGERTKRIKLATGVVSLPYHHPFNVAQRMVQLDHMTGGRAIFGSGPGALASDAHTLGDRSDGAARPPGRGDRRHPPAVQRRARHRQESDWFTLQDAALQLLPLQEEMPFAVASQISPSGMTLAGKHGIGIISIGSLSEEGLNALPTQWGFAEAAAAKHGKTVDRKNWRVLLSWHIAETREKARAEARDGLMRHHNEYITATLQRPGARPFTTPDEAVDKTAFSQGAVATIGTPDDLVARIKSVLEISGGFGTVVGFVHDWANPENTMRSWDMVARYVVPEINGYLAGLRKSRDFVANNREYFDRAREAVMAKIIENEAAAAALAVTQVADAAPPRPATCPTSPGSGRGPDRPRGGQLSAGQSARLQCREIGGPALLLFAAQLVQILPGVDAGIVAVVEQQPHGIIADRLDPDNRDMPLPRHGPLLVAARAPAPQRWGFRREGTRLAARTSVPSSNSTRSTRSRPFEPDLGGDRPSVLQLAGLLGQHDRDAVAHRIGQASLAADQFACFTVIFQRALGQRTDQDLQQPRIDRWLVPRLGRVVHAPISVNSRCGRPAHPAPAHPSAAAPARPTPALHRWAPPAAPAFPPARTGTPSPKSPPACRPASA